MSTELIFAIAIGAFTTAGAYIYGHARGVAQGFAEGRRRPRKPKPHALGTPQ